MTATYVYCVVASPRRPKLTRTARGLRGTGPIRLLDLDGGLFAVVSDAPAAQYGEAVINRRLSNLDWVSRAAVAHELVAERYVDSGTCRAVLPMKLFTIFANDERALAYLRGERPRLAGLVRRVAGHDEWGVRVLIRRAAAVAASLARTRRTSRRAKAMQTQGAAYLAGKKAQRDASLELTGRAREAGRALYDRLASRAKLARRRSAAELPDQAAALVLDAAFLVRRSRAASFRALVAREARALAADGYAVALTGPWPPYSFVQD